MKNKVENWQEELERCKNSFEYFYNNYCRRDGMPEYSEEAYQAYLKDVEESRYIISRTHRGKALNMYPLTPKEAFKTN